LVPLFGARDRRARLDAGVAGSGSDTDDRPAKWSFISAAIIEPACATVGCHSPSRSASVDLSARQVGYDSLYNRHFVTPGYRMSRR
jgi:hypothetical protein